MPKTLVLYAFNSFNEGVYSFIKHGLFEDKDIHFLFICNNMNIDDDIHIDIIIPKYVTIIKRENVGFDFGAWSVGALSYDLYKSYDYLIFLNSSVVGPYLPKDCVEKWPNILTSNLNDNVKLFGCTINTMNWIEVLSHVQSYCFCLTRETFEMLVERGTFSLTDFKKTKKELSESIEVYMSRHIIDSGYNIGCLCPGFDIDYTFKKNTPEGVAYRDLHADPTAPEHYNTRWKSTDVMFIKRNRKYKLTEEDKKLFML